MPKAGIMEDDGRVVGPGTDQSVDDILGLVSAVETCAPDNPDRQVGLAVIVTVMIAKSNNLPKKLLVDLLDSSWELSSMMLDENGNRDQ